MRAVSRPFIFAWHFLTVIPLSRSHHEPTDTELAASMAWYPVVGLLIGGCLALADLALGRFLSHPVINALLIILLVVLTRGLHQDGLADSLDGLAGGNTPSERLAIMRDPRVGAIGATGLFLSLILRYACLSVLPPDVRLPTLICMPAVGRWAMVTLAWLSPYARIGGGLAAPFLHHISWLHVLVSTTILAGALIVGFGLPGAALVLGVGVLLVLLAWFLYRLWFGGITGDTLGATNELVELAFLLLVPLLILLL